ncbi:MAG TPA: porin family protein [Cyclobacteriaceae bacterium]|nr:porin family protein [Cyclobacteriaceae bacterium]HRJ80819.1 porin family protein [Cyclobacteriaceae bacterium]
MQTADIRNKFYIHRSKVVTVILLFISFVSQAQSFLYARKNNPFYDEKRKITYGFLIGLHTTAYQVNYNDKFVTPAFDTLFAVTPEWKPGFSLGFIVNYRAHEFLDFRITPKVAFYEHSLIYRFTDGTSEKELVETTMVEFPMLVKYKSMRRGNVRMYMIGGIKPGIEASGKKEIENVSDQLEVTPFNLSLEAGLGFDLYFPLFKFSPEIRFSRGIINHLDNTTNKFGAALSRINTNTVTVYLLFQ